MVVKTDRKTIESSKVLSMQTYDGKVNSDRQIWANGESKATSNQRSQSRFKGPRPRQKQRTLNETFLHFSLYLVLISFF